MQKNLKYFIILAILLAPVNFVFAVSAAPVAVCDISAKVTNIQLVEVTTPAIGVESRAVKFYQVDLAVNGAKAVSGQEINDCSYVGSSASAKYSIDNFNQKPLSAEQMISGLVQLQGDERFNGLMLWDVKIDGQNDLYIEQNKLAYKLTKAEVAAGKKYRVFKNNFVFQIEPDSFAQDTEIELKELILAPGSSMEPPPGLLLASKIYQYAVKPLAATDFAEDFWFSIKYSDDDYFRKNLFYYDETAQKWQGLESIISNGASKIIAHSKAPALTLAILQDTAIMTAGAASWYKYKGCNCAASPDYPKGTKLKVTNVANNKSVIVKVNDWGPDRSIHPNRVIDLDVVAFKAIASKSAGLCQVKVELAESVKTATK